ncbi:hypothetical protein NXC24_CH04014 [Rhizobium sp. NXC24]|nr:hypothetical protein NXC24_CH04014 [Rhizobium sp. NXC24]
MVPIRAATSGENCQTVSVFIVSLPFGFFRRSPQPLLLQNDILTAETFKTDPCLQCDPSRANAMNYCENL